jgi:hypothetical protein
MNWTQEYRILLQGWLKGHQEAYTLVLTLFEIAHTCDDLTDRDKTVETSAVQQAFWQALIDLPRNRFYVEHFALLNGAVQTAFLNWQVANCLEVRADPNAKEIAFILRSSYIDLVTLCAWILGGNEWAIQVGVEARLHASQEGFAVYQERLTQEARSPYVVGGV